MSWFKSKEKAPAPAAESVFEVKAYEVVSTKPAILRMDPDMQSYRTGEVEPGSIIEVLEESTLKDGTVRARTYAGWLTKSKAPVVERVEFLVETAAELEAMANETGSDSGAAPKLMTLMTSKPAILRAQKELSSEQMGEMPPGSQARGGWRVR